MDELNLTDSRMRDISAITNADIDIAVGKENDFEIKIRRDDWKEDYTFGNMVYIQGTEYGGVIGEIDTDTNIDTISLVGRTWRGMLEKKIISPPEGQDYMIVSGELNAIMRDIIGQRFGDIFYVSDSSTGITVNNFQFERYCTILSGFEKMLKSVNYKLHIEYRQMKENGCVELSAVPIEDYSDEIELSQDSKLNFKMKDIRNGVNHLICLGKGELQEREVLHLYVQQNGSIGTTQYYTGQDEIEETYENTSAETSQELREGGEERLREIMNGTSFSMDVETLGIEVEIGDYIGGRDYLTGLYMKKPVKGKIYKKIDSVYELEYEIEGDESEE